ncbi:hypothetical protein Dda3937_01448 [Dickeya dadantii 3937]|uniref:Uncharacterized protein n=1 Tax=Dickeya dadantii (strain 3937) TaxID=198628 RepID=E0SB70_DICD3|nr:hypothetical protein Dda3937_01448 [Dickeya dadantii 3937]
MFFIFRPNNSPEISIIAPHHFYSFWPKKGFITQIKKDILITQTNNKNNINNKSLDNNNTIRASYRFLQLFLSRYTKN